MITAIKIFHLKCEKFFVGNKPYHYLDVGHGWNKFGNHWVRAMAAPDLDGGGPGAQAWWEAPCVDRIKNLQVEDGR